MSEYQTPFGTVGQPATPEKQLAAAQARIADLERERDSIRADRDSQQRVAIQMMSERDAHIAIGQAFVDEINRISGERDDLTPRLAAADAQVAELREALTGMLESYDLLFVEQAGLPPVTADMVRGVFIGEPGRARALLGRQQPGGE